jgi:hypothetical protein
LYGRSGDRKSRGRNPAGYLPYEDEEVRVFACVWPERRREQSAGVFAVDITQPRLLVLVLVLMLVLVHVLVFVLVLVLVLVLARSRARLCFVVANSVPLLCMQLPCGQLQLYESNFAGTSSDGRVNMSMPGDGGSEPLSSGIALIYLGKLYLGILHCGWGSLMEAQFWSAQSWKAQSCEAQSCKAQSCKAHSSKTLSRLARLWLAQSQAWLNRAAGSIVQRLFIS